MALKTVCISKSTMEVVKGGGGGNVRWVCYIRTSAIRATFAQRPPIYNGHFFVPAADSPCIDSYNGNGNGNGHWNVSPTAKII